MTLGSHWVDPTALTQPRPAPTGWARDAVAVSAAMFDAPEADDARLCWVGAELRTLMAEVDPMTKLLFRGSLALLTWLGPWLVLRPGPFRRCARPQQLRILHRYERSPIGLTLLAVKAMLCIVWFEHPHAARDAHFDGDAPDAATEP